MGSVGRRGAHGHRTRLRVLRSTYAVLGGAGQRSEDWANAHCGSVEAANRNRDAFEQRFNELVASVEKELKIAFPRVSTCFANSNSNDQDRNRRWGR